MVIMRACWCESIVLSYLMSARLVHADVRSVFGSISYILRSETTNDYSNKHKERL